MASQAEVQALRDGLNGLSGAAQRDLAVLWGAVAAGTVQDQRELLDDVWADLIGTYGELAAVVGADLFEEWVPGKPAVMVRPVDPERADARMRWALTTPNPLGNLNLLTDELVKQPARSTIVRSAESNRVRWARVPSGKTCAFCLTGASRGFRYRSAESADRSFHGSCDCTVIAGTSPADYPDGYDPDALADKYAAAREQAGSGDLRKITAALRDAEGIQ